MIRVTVLSTLSSFKFFTQEFAYAHMLLGMPLKKCYFRSKTGTKLAISIAKTSIFKRKMTFPEFLEFQNDQTHPETPEFRQKNDHFFLKNLIFISDFMLM